MPGLSPTGARIGRRREASAIRRRGRRAWLQSRREELLVVSHAEGRSARLAFQIHRSSDSHRQTGRAVSVLIIIHMSLYAALRRHETMKIGGESSATCRGCAVSQLVHCRRGATSAGCATLAPRFSPFQGVAAAHEGSSGKFVVVIPFA